MTIIDELARRITYALIREGHVSHTAFSATFQLVRAELKIHETETLEKEKANDRIKSQSPAA